MESIASDLIIPFDRLDFRYGFTVAINGCHRGRNNRQPFSAKQMEPLCIFRKYMKHLFINFSNYLKINEIKTALQAAVLPTHC